MKTRLIVLGMILTTVVVSVGFGLLAGASGRHFYRPYKQLRLGTTQSQVRSSFGKPPDFECRYRSSEIWYYRAPGFLTPDSDEITLKSGAMVETLDELPDVYDHVQLAFDAPGRLHAYTWIGETYTVESTNGSVKGSRLSKLSPSSF